MKNNIHLRIICLIMILFFASVPACAPIDSSRYSEEFDPISPSPMEEAMFESMTETVVPSNLGETMLRRLESQDAVSGDHMMGNILHKAPDMFPEDRAYLKAQCTGCHTLDRVFWRRGPHSTWVKIMEHHHHQEIILEAREKEKLYEIFKQYLHKLE